MSGLGRRAVSALSFAQPAGRLRPPISAHGPAAAAAAAASAGATYAGSAAPRPPPAPRLAARPPTLCRRPWPARMASHIAGGSDHAAAPHAGMHTGGVPGGDDDGGAAVEALVAAIHASPSMAVVYATGGGVRSLTWLLQVPGASRTVLEAGVPYSRASLEDVLGGQPPTKFCSEDTARAMATAARRRAAALSPFGVPLVGVGVTASLATDPPKRGEHHAHVAASGPMGVTTLSITLAKGARSRGSEDDLVSRAVLRVLAQAAGVDPSALPLPTLSEGDAPGGQSHNNGSGEGNGALCDVVTTSHTRAEADPVQALLDGRAKIVEYSANGVVMVDAPRTRKVVLPGSFNPLHDGHRALLAAAAKRVGMDTEGCFELSVGNADKGMLTAEEVHRRVAQFTNAGLAVLLTSAPLFTEKAALLQGCTFVLGWDTAMRIVMPKYYGDSETNMFLDFAGLRGMGCSFVVAGRRDEQDGRFKGLEDIDVPPQLADLFVGLSEDDFRVDLSSTELRERLAATTGP